MISIPQDYAKIKFRKKEKKEKIKKFRLDYLSFLDAFITAAKEQESLKLKDIFGLTETNNHYDLDELIIGLSTEDAKFLSFRSNSVIIKPYEPDKIYQRGSLSYPPFDQFLSNEGYVFGKDITSDNQGDYIFQDSGRKKIILGHLRKIIRLDYVEDVMMILSVK